MLNDFTMLVRRKVPQLVGGRIFVSDTKGVRIRPRLARSSRGLDRFAYPAMFKLGDDLGANMG